MHPNPHAIDYGPGRTLRSWQLGGFSVFHKTVPGGNRVEPHWHDVTTVTLLLQGEASERIGRRRIRQRNERVATTLPAGETHSLEFSQAPAQVLTIELDRHASSVLFSGQRRTMDFQLWIMPNAYLWAVKLLRHLHCQVPELCQMAVSEACAQLVNADQPVAFSKTNRPKWLTRAHAQLTEETDAKLELLAMSQSAGIDFAHFSRSFTTHFQMTATEIRQRARLEKACRRLAAGSSALADVAAECGFADQSHFGRILRRMTGATPQQARRLLRPG
jgi:AraC family transcriptional regulator